MIAVLQDEIDSYIKLAAVIGGGGAGLFIAIRGLFAIQARVAQRYDELERDRAEDVKAARSDARAARREVAEVRAELLSVHHEHADCRRQLGDAVARITALERGTS